MHFLLLSLIKDRKKKSVTSIAVTKLNKINKN